MPTYAYACKDCGSAFDIQQSFTDDTLTVCPTCRGALRKKFNSVGVVFKGSGFYRTDSRDAKNSIPAVKTDAGTSSAGSTPSGTSTASAPSTGSSSTGSSAGSSAGTGSSAA